MSQAQGKREVLLAEREQLDFCTFVPVELSWNQQKIKADAFLDSGAVDRQFIH